MSKFLKSIFYIVPHADDWQLFMNPQAWEDITTQGNKVVFIITTAGDAGKGKEYWLAREDGMKASVLYCFPPGMELNISEGSAKTDSSGISFWTVNNVNCYFLRLPDGGISGEGFKENQYQSLEKLEKGLIESLTSQDGNHCFNTWEEFCAFLDELICREIETGKERTCINILDPDLQHNPSDHADHRCTGRAVQALRSLYPCKKIFFNGYGNSCTSNLEPEEIFLKAGIFTVYEKMVFDKTGYRTLAENPEQYKKWIISRPEFYVAKQECEEKPVC